MTNEWYGLLTSMTEEGPVAKAEQRKSSKRTENVLGEFCEIIYGIGQGIKQENG